MASARPIHAATRIASTDPTISGHKCDCAQRGQARKCVHLDWSLYDAPASPCRNVFLKHGVGAPLYIVESESMVIHLSFLHLLLCYFANGVRTCQVLLERCKMCSKYLEDCIQVDAITQHRLSHLRSHYFWKVPPSQTSHSNQNLVLPYETS